MKNRIIFPVYWFLCFLRLFTLFGCGDIENEDTAETLELLEVVSEPSEADERPDDWYKTLDIPHGWHEVEELDLRNDYFHAVLLNQFGDIPEVHIIAGYYRKKADGLPITVDERTAFLESHARLWPSKQNDKVLENHNKIQEMNETEDPERFAELFREYLLNRFGDLPEVDILVEVEKKWKEGGAVTDEEYLVYLQARQLLFPSVETLLEIRDLLNEQAEE